MSWDTEIVTLVRNYVGDTDVTNQKYTDTSMKDLILSSAQFVVVDVPLSQDYIVDIPGTTLTPDPTSRATETSRDNTFINLIVLKSAWMIANGELRNYASQAISIRDGTSAIDLKRDLKALAAILDQMKDAYFEYKDRYIRDNLTTGELITTPIRIMADGFWNGADPYSGPLFRNYRW
jgi:hypothetical protein